MTPPRIGACKIIHCFLPIGRATRVLTRLKKEKGIVSAYSHHARGGGISTRKGRESFYYSERDIVSLLVAEERADEIFEFVYRAAGLSEPHAGMVLMERARVGVPMTLPEGVPDEE